MISHSQLLTTIRDLESGGTKITEASATGRHPEVTVSMPAYNTEAYVGAAIRSVLTQRDIEVELIVVDDGSDDRTKEVVRGCADPRVRLISLDQHRGIGYCHNTVIRHSTAPIIVHVDSDDIVLPGALRLMVDKLCEGENIGQVYAFHYQVEEDGMITEEEFERQTSFLIMRAAATRDYRRDLIVHGMVVNHLRTYRRAVFDAVGLFNEELRYAVDYEMALRVAGKFDMALVPSFLYVARVHATNVQQNLRFKGPRFWWKRVLICHRQLRLQSRVAGWTTSQVCGLLLIGLLHVLRLPVFLKRVYRIAKSRS